MKYSSRKKWPVYINKLLILSSVFMAAKMSAGQSEIRIKRQVQVQKQLPCSEFCQQALQARKRIEIALKKENVTPKSFAQEKSAVIYKGVVTAQKEITTYLKPFKGPLSQDALDGLLMIWAAAVEYDSIGIIGLNNVELLAPHLERIYAHIDLRLKSPKSPVTKKQLDKIQIAMMLVEAEAEGDGNDPGAE
ncbi:MAG: hypothetical protein KDD35_09045 [Bdellovibrionales bacterium]|nr:hypothetical protein [Bdellovibrionales bacterium]